MSLHFPYLFALTLKQTFIHIYFQGFDIVCDISVIDLCFFVLFFVSDGFHSLLCFINPMSFSVDNSFTDFTIN